ncbi:MAG: lysophospholipase [Planctomycetota bacterium]
MPASELGLCALTRPLSCVVVEASTAGATSDPTGGQTPAAKRIPVVLCHGYGAPGDDLAGLAEPLIQWLGEHASRFRFIFPAAPHDLSSLGMPQGRAWWPLNMAALQQMLATSQFEQLHVSIPPGLDDSRESLVKTMREILAESDGPYVLGGFSQGAMLTMDTVLQSELPPPILLIQFSGTLICQDQWASRLPRLHDTAVLQSHGRFDPILPYTSAEALRDLVESSAKEMEYVAFDGPHTIEPETLMKMTQRLHAIAESMSEPSERRPPLETDDS